MFNDNVSVIKERVSLLQIIKERIKVTKKGNRYVALCPFHKEKTPSFTVDSTRDLFHCFGCGKGGDIFEFLIQYEKFSFKEALEYLANIAGVKIEKNLSSIKEVPFVGKKNFYDLLAEASKWFNQQLFLSQNLPALDYLYKRGISKYTIDSFQLGYAPPIKDSLSNFLIEKGFNLGDLITLGLNTVGENSSNYNTFRDRIIFPIKNKTGKIIAFGGRKLKEEGGPKYLNSKDSVVFHKKLNLYGLSEALKIIKETKSIILVEGYLDVLILQQHGFAAVAPLGTAISKEQLDILVKLKVPIFICLDGDEAGKNASLKVAQLLLEIIEEDSLPKFISLPSEEDPDSFLRKNTRDAFIGCQKNALLLSEFLWQTTIKDLNLNSPEIKALLQKKFFYYCSLIKNNNLKEAYLNYFKDKLNINFNRSTSTYKPLLPNYNKVNKEYVLNKVKFSIAKNNILQNNIKKNNLLIREYFLLSYIIFCPEIYNVVGEDFAVLSFSSYKLESLKQMLVSLLEINTLNTKSLHDELAKNGFNVILNDIAESLPVKKALLRLHTPEDFIKAFYDTQNRELYTLLNNDILNIKASLPRIKEDNKLATKITRQIQQLQIELKKTNSFKGKL